MTASLRLSLLQLVLKAAPDLALRGDHGDTACRVVDTLLAFVTRDADSAGERARARAAQATAAPAYRPTAEDWHLMARLSEMRRTAAMDLERLSKDYALIAQMINHASQAMDLLDSAIVRVGERGPSGVGNRDALMQLGMLRGFHQDEHLQELRDAIRPATKASESQAADGH